ncbi:acetate/propionate family kinase [Actinomycetospora lutea]|uniref:acetate/propionate family kinase n=1 Tax=Actinomycetospora lutea TaxID=663604 RepID=UPI0023657FEF|nr:acetate/propionate family kinase [Actinomycetospora lutea]MDD7939618.1 acetate/propionate family kinase [Actinomycetospora lutea]
MRVLVLNAGSSSVKLRVVEPDDRVVHRRDLDAPRGRPAAGELEATALRLAREAGGVDAVGHRVVHGGADLTTATVVDAHVLDRIDRLTALAPLHQPPAVAGVRAMIAALPDAPSVACFDTAFHATMPEAARTYAVPRWWRSELGLRRYGFHGLAHDWASARAAELVDRPLERLRVVVAHLGSGASACAVRDGRSVDTTMGFTPTAGLVMGTRCGDLDPSAVTWLVRRAGRPVDEVDHALDHGSGLLALAGDADMRHVLDAADGGDADARLAVDVWVHRACAQLAAMAAACGGLDVLAFSGGVGENSPVLRRRVAAGLGFLGVAVDPGADALAVGGVEADVSAADARARTVVVHVREDLVIARQVRAVLAGR